MPFKVKIRSSDMGESKKQKAKKARRRLYPLRFLPLNSVVAL
jgi:hypothetical protein